MAGILYHTEIPCHLCYIPYLFFQYECYFTVIVNVTFSLFAVFVRKIEVEVENLDMVKEAVEAGADIIMLDNMSVEEMKEAIRIIDGRAQTECSGNVTKENIDHLTSLGVDYISSGALTHSAPVLDISLKNLHAL